jgi:hypothetical protein
VKVDAKSPKPDLSTICLTGFLIGSKILKIAKKIFFFFFFSPDSINHAYSPFYKWWEDVKVSPERSRRGEVPFLGFIFLALKGDPLERKK